jgi:hypothetical protein
VIWPSSLLDPRILGEDTFKHYPKAASCSENIKCPDPITSDSTKRSFLRTLDWPCFSLKTRLLAVRAGALASSAYFALRKQRLSVKILGRYQRKRVPCLAMPLKSPRRMKSAMCCLDRASCRCTTTTRKTSCALHPSVRGIRLT